MIYGNIKDLKSFSFLEDRVKKSLEYAQENNLLSFKKGTYEIEGIQLFVNIVEYNTTVAENRFWEAHRDYVDIHLILSGSEQIDVNFIDNMVKKEFVSKDDFLPLEGKKKASIIMQTGDFLICYPKDGHRTAVQIGKPEQVKKAIFKVKIKK